MKNFGLLIMITFAVFIVTNQTTQATSGACSYHDGVNCSYGATSDGKVMCNDGWVNSSIYFSDVQECKVECSYPAQPYCDLDQIMDDESSALSSARATAGRSGTLSTGMWESQKSSIESQYSLEYDSCKSQWKAHESGLNNYESCVQGSLQSTNNSSISADEKIEARMREYCIDANGPLSEPDWKKFENRDDNPCTNTIDEMHDMCKQQAGEAYYDKYDSHCKCIKSGHVISSGTGQCIPGNEERRTVLLKHFAETIKTMPEYRGIADADIIVTIAMGSASVNKTMREIIVETYPNIGKPVVPYVTPEQGVVKTPQAPIQETEKQQNIDSGIYTPEESSDVFLDWPQGEQSNYGEVSAFDDNTEEEVVEAKQNVIVRFWGFLKSWF